MSSAGGLRDDDLGLLREMLDAIPDAIALLDGKGGVELENGAMRELRNAVGTEALGLTADAGAPDVTVAGRKYARHVTSFAPTAGAIVVLQEIYSPHDAGQLREGLFAMVSHELRTPLASIIGYLDLAREGAVGAQRGYLDVVDRNARRLLRLVDDLMFSAQVEAGQIPLTATEFNLVGVLEEAVEAAGPRARARGIALELAIERSTTCLGDRDRVSQVVDNLISNALKFTPPGGQVTARLAGSEAASARDAIVEISDSGPGVPREEQSQLFERFYRSPEAVEQEVPGVGLGLSIVKAIVEAHGGRIGVRGNDAGGATFELALPLRSGVCEGAQEASGRSSRSEPEPRTFPDSALGRGR